MPATTAHTAAAAPRLCPSCHQGHLQPATYERQFQPRGELVRVELLTSVCDHCGAEAPSASQHQQNLNRLAARKAQYGGLLLGEEIAALRRKYGLTQQLASRIFGKGKIAFSRYESETTYPDESTTKLLTMAIAKPDALKWLADQAGVDIPLWRERCEDGRMSLRLVDTRGVHVAKSAQTQYLASAAESTGTTGGWSPIPAAQRQASPIKHLTPSLLQEAA